MSAYFAHNLGYNTTLTAEQVPRSSKHEIVWKTCEKNYLMVKRGVWYMKKKLGKYDVSQIGNSGEPTGYKC